jgi:hypothetical protein
MYPNKKLWRSIIAVAGLLATAASAQADNRIVEPGEVFAGRSHHELVSEWTNWFAASPIATHPAFDPDGRFCDLNQQGPVWFLTGTFEGIAERTCEIPAGKAIFLNLGGSAVSFAPEFPAADDPCSQLATTLERVRCDVNNDVPVAPHASFQVALDGQPIGDLFAHRAQSTPEGFTLRVPDPSFLTDLGLPAGDRFPAVGDGYFLFLKPLQPGVHTLTLRTTNPDQSVTGADFTLIVEED